MERVAIRFLVATAVILAAAAVSSGELVDETSATAGLLWTTGKDEPDLLSKAEPENSDDSSAAAVVNDHDDLDGGFSSLEGMLHWAIGHSDPTRLKQSAEDVQRLSASELQKRQLELKELMEKMKMPSDAELMHMAIDDLNNSSSSLEDRQRALQELLILVEPLDNANDLNKLGGLAIVIQELDHPDQDIRRLSAWVLGKACQNNAAVQKQILELGALSKLIKMVKSSSIEEAIKALYAVSTLIRNNLAGQEFFYAEDGDAMLQEILSNSSNDIRLRRKAVSVVADLAEYQLENIVRAESPCFRNRFFLKSVVDLTASTDLDLQEKALVAIKNLLQLKTTEALVLKDLCNLDGSLERMRQQLLDLMAEEDHRDYAVDLETLRREVELIFHEKLGKVMKVPT
ncbi:hsp70 nucleotide exchange factor FES1-like [Populus alba x Populus x berolinensis]|uniref:Hsp70 nucleotide exchange factor FES1-like n=1 Tax=Populus alba x Populus x berolinensis TaxID=444605 RepID=A0AAD6RJL1_9ROSI|nr:hsp70 nucleotide exchange factor FES1-like [Populus alba x Populus x berolinensis]